MRGTVGYCWGWATPHAWPSRSSAGEDTRGWVVVNDAQWLLMWCTSFRSTARLKLDAKFNQRIGNVVAAMLVRYCLMRLRCMPLFLTSVAWRGQFWQASLRDAWPDPSVWVPESTLPRHTTAYRASHNEDRGWRAKLAQVRAVSPLAYLRCHRSCPYSCDGGDALFSCGTPACRTWVRRMIEVKNAAQLGTWIR